MEATKLTISANELIKMLSDAAGTYGDRIVFVEINDKRYSINDLVLTANGNCFKLILS